jgi:hypothetical protein
VLSNIRGGFANRSRAANRGLQLLCKCYRQIAGLEASCQVKFYELSKSRSI